MTESIHPALRGAFEQLSASGARWALLRAPRSLARVEGDIDVLVHPGDMMRATSKLREGGFLPIGGSGSSRPLVAYDTATHSWIHLDLTTRVLPEAFGASARLSAICLERRRGGNPIWRLQLGDEFWSLLAHLTEPGRRPSARHWDALRRAVQNADGSPVATLLARRIPAGPAVLAEALEAVRADDAVRLHDALGHMGSVAIRQGLATRLLRYVRRPRDVWRYRGISVALLGPDGAGKSTLAQCLRDTAFFPTRIVYMGTGVSGELRARPRALRMLRGPVLFSLGGIATQWIRYLVGMAERLRGRLVIFDRYTEEALLPPKPGARPWQRAGRVVRRRLVCPPPELAIILDASGPVMFSRKGEHDAAMLEAERYRYRALVMRLPNAVVIDAEQSPSEVCSHAMEGIWRAYGRRFASPQPRRALAEGPSSR